MADRLRITELDFDTIKQNLKNFLNQQTEFTDYDFEGSGLSVLLDILAYNTHYNAYYLNMVANESFLDTAILRDSVVSLAKTLGYLPYSVKCPVATIDFTASSSSNTSGSLTLQAGSSFLSNQIDGKAYNFVVVNDTTVTKSNTSYYFENLEIYEGQYVTYNFNYNQQTNPKSIFTLPDNNIDTTTLKVQVASSPSNTSISTYNLVSDVLDVTGTSEVYFLQEGRNGQFQIYFGNDAVGKSLPDGALVRVNYVVTNGTTANKANSFVFISGSVTDSNSEAITNLQVASVSAAAGGADRETIDTIKFSAASQFSTQNRLVTYKDYESYLLKNYPSVDSLSVWGGEEETPPVYGKVFIALKPKSGYYISETEKQRIIDEIIKPKAIVSTSVTIRDPKYLYLLVENYVEYDPKKTTLTSEQLKTAIKDVVVSYNTTYLNKFSSSFVLSKLQDSIDTIDTNAIKGSEVTLRLQKRFEPQIGISANYTIDFSVPIHRGTTNNKLVSNQFGAYDITGTIQNAQIEETPESFTGVSSITVLDPGTGYITAPTVTITGDGTGATAEAVILNGRIQSINVVNRGINYTRAVITISGGDGYGGAAVAVLDGKKGTLRLVYYDTNAQRQTINNNLGTINYDTGLIQINDLRVVTLSTTDAMIRLTIESEKGIVDSSRNTIISIDTTDPFAISTELVEVSI
jgi:hypothetical protein